MFKVKFYNYNDKFDFLADMMIKDNLVEVVVIEEMPKNDESIELILNYLGKFEGYLYELVHDDYVFATGIYTCDSIAEDIYELLKIGGYLNEEIIAR